MPYPAADPAAVACGLALLDGGDVDGAEQASGVHRSTLYRWRDRRDARDPKTLALLASATAPAPAPPAAPLPAASPAPSSPMSWLAFLDARRARGDTAFSAALDLELAPQGIERPSSLTEILDACGPAELADLAGWIVDVEHEDEELDPADRTLAAVRLLHLAALELLPGVEDAAEDAPPVETPAAA